MLSCKINSANIYGQLIQNYSVNFYPVVQGRMILVIFTKHKSGAFHKTLSAPIVKAPRKF